VIVFERRGWSLKTILIRCVFVARRHVVYGKRPK